MNSNDPIISVIVPVYNSERWLGKCINSIQTQSFVSFELILVDDGSTDSCSQLCDDFECQDVRIRTVHIPNGGVSNARNVGLELAKGKYVVFIDSDDWVENDYLATLLDALSTSQAQLGVCGVIAHSDESPATVTWKAPFKTVCISNNHAEELLLLNKTFLLYGPVNKIYERETIDRNNIRFDYGTSYGEDSLFNFKYLDYVERIGVSERPLYHYRQATPASLSKKYYPDKFEIDMRVFEVIHCFFEKYGLSSDDAKRWLWTRYFWSVHDGLFLINHPHCELELREKFYRVREILSHPQLPTALKFADTAKCPRAVLFCIMRRNALAFFTLNVLINVKAEAFSS